MFGFFKTKTPIQKLEEKYAQLTQEAHKLWQTNRKAGDEKMTEAENIMQEILKLKEQTEKK
jgi:hypothetical protein